MLEVIVTADGRHGASSLRINYDHRGAPPALAMIELKLAVFELEMAIRKLMNDADEMRASTTVRVDPKPDAG